MADGYESIAFNSEISQTTYTEIITVNQKTTEAIPDYTYIDYTSEDCATTTSPQLLKYSLSVKTPQIIPTEPVYNSCEIKNPAITLHWSDIPNKNIAIYALCVQYVVRNPLDVTKTRTMPLLVNGYKVLNRPNIEYSTTWYNSTRTTRTDFDTLFNDIIKPTEIALISDGDTKRITNKSYAYIDIIYNLDKQDYLTLTLDEFPLPSEGIIESVTVCALANTIGEFDGTDGSDDTSLVIDLKYKRNGQYTFFSKNFPTSSFDDGDANLAVWKKIATFNLDVLANNGLDQITVNSSDVYQSSIDTSISKFKVDMVGFYSAPCVPSINVLRIQRGYGVNEIQYFSIPGATGGSFTITFLNDTTVDIGLGAVAQDIENALAALDSIAVGNVSVTGTGSVSSPYFITFINNLGGQDLPLVSVNGDKLSGLVPIKISELTQGSYNERQRLEVPNGISFRVSYNTLETQVLLTPSNLQMRKALEGLLGEGNIIVTAPNGYGNNSTINHSGPWDVDFVGDLKGQNVDELVIYTISNAYTFFSNLTPIDVKLAFGSIVTTTLYPTADASANGIPGYGFFTETMSSTNIYTSIDESGAADSHFIANLGYRPASNSTSPTAGGVALFKLGALAASSIGRSIAAKFNYTIDNCNPDYPDSGITAEFGYLGQIITSYVKTAVFKAKFYPWRDKIRHSTSEGNVSGVPITLNVGNILNYPELYLDIRTDFYNAPVIRLGTNNVLLDSFNNPISLSSIDISDASNRINKFNVTFTYETSVADSYDSGYEDDNGLITTALTVRSSNLGVRPLFSYFVIKSPTVSGFVFNGTRKFRLFPAGVTPSTSDINDYKAAVEEVFDYIKTQTGEVNDNAFHRIRFVTLSDTRISTETHPPALLWFNNTPKNDDIAFNNTRNGHYFSVMASSSLLVIASTQEPEGIVTTLWQGGVGINEKQRIDISKGKGGSFTLSYDECTTSPIHFGASAADVQSALEALTCIGANVSVVLSSANVYDVEFINDLGRTNHPLMTSNATGLLGATIVPKVKVNGVSGNQEIQRVSINNTKSGTYRFIYDDEYSDYIQYNESASYLQAVLTNMLVFRNAGIMVFGDDGGIGVPGGPYTIIFGEGRGAFDLLGTDTSTLSCSDVPLEYVGGGPYEYDLNVPSDTFEVDSEFKRTLTPSSNIAKFLTYERDLIDPNTKINGYNATIKDTLIIKSAKPSLYTTYKYTGTELVAIGQSTEIYTGLSIVAINTLIDTVRIRELIIIHLQTKRGILPARMNWDNV
jgi:hypothetical protein